MTRQTITQLVIMAAAAAAMFHYGHRTAATVVMTLFVIVLLLAVFATSTLQTIQELARRGGVWVGTGLGLVLLTIVYFTVFLPGALLLRVFGSDPLNRTFPTGGKTNWIDRVNYGEKLLYEKTYSRPHAATVSKEAKK